MKQLTRRQFLFGLSAASIVLVVAVSNKSKLLLHWGNFKTDRLSTGHKIANFGAYNVDLDILATSATLATYLTGGLIGNDESKELQDIFLFVSQHDSNYYEELAFCVTHCENLTRKIFNKPLTKLTAIESDKFIHKILGDAKQHRGRKSKLLALFSDQERSLRIMHSSTIPLIFRVYAHSGAYWKNKHYTNWPGVPGDTFGYMSQSKPPTC